MADVRMPLEDGRFESLLQPLLEGDVESGTYHIFFAEAIAPRLPP